MDVVETEAPIEVNSGDTALDGVHRPSLFRGSNEYAIDDKGRLTVPPQMRRPLAGGGNLVVLEDRVVIYDELTYQLAVDTLNELVSRQELSQAHVRGFLSSTHPVNPDTQGRIVVPHSARVEAGLDRDVVVLGAGPRIEIVPAGGDALDGVLGVDDSIVAALDRANL